MYENERLLRKKSIKQKYIFARLQRENFTAKHTSKYPPWLHGILYTFPVE